MKSILLRKYSWLILGAVGILAFREFFVMNIFPFLKPHHLFESKRLIFFIITTAIAIAGWGFGLFRLDEPPALVNTQRRSTVLPILAITILICLPGLVKWFVSLPENTTIGNWMVIFMITIDALVLAWFFPIKRIPQHHAVVQLAIYALLIGSAYTAMLLLNQVTMYPFPLYWSEGNRFFDYSTLFGKFRYQPAGDEDIYVFINWGMQLPWAIPFIFPNISIGFFRLWYQLIWIVPHFALGASSAAFRTALKDKWLYALLFGSYAFLFLNQGPIYAPIIIAAILTIIAVRSKPVPAVMLVMIASFYAKSSRWTWSYAPGLWAGLLTLISIKKPSFKKGSFKQLLLPVALGLSGYLVGQFLPELFHTLEKADEISLLPNPIPSTSRQPLLWERLLPNSTYAPGILLGVAWAALPAIFLIAALIASKKWRLNGLQIAAVIVVPGVFLVIGIIASTKIGGGSNLHNLDMFLITILLLTITAVIEALKTDHHLFVGDNLLVSLAIVAAFLTPITYSMREGTRIQLPEQAKIDESLAAVRNKVAQFSEVGEVLFIDHRQLLTFNLVENVPLIDEYEKKKLMDNALAGDQAYFEDFYHDIGRHRFALIVNEPLNITTQDDAFSFGEENNAYVRWVTMPLFCTYTPIYTSRDTGLELLVPRSGPAPGNIPCEQFFVN